MSGVPNINIGSLETEAKTLLSNPLDNEPENLQSNKIEEYTKFLEFVLKKTLSIDEISKIEHLVK